MKIKRLLVMALTAAATLTVFSGCGGGGGEEGGSGYISAKKFANGGYVIRTQNTRSLEISPERNLQGSTGGSVVILPGEEPSDASVVYEVEDRVRCSGTIGAYGEGNSVAYSAEFLYSITTEDIGVIQVTITSSRATDDSFFLAALGFAVSNVSNDSSSTSSGTYYERLTVSHVDDLSLYLLLNFSTSYMDIITAGTGYNVTFTSADGSSVTQTFTKPIRCQTVQLPYYVQVK